MKTLAKIYAAAFVMGGALALTATPAMAGFSLSIGLGYPAFDGYYHYDAPCWWYRQWDLPAPRRCYSYLEYYWGPSIYTEGGFIFRDRNEWRRWRHRDAFGHWRRHDFRWRARGNWVHDHIRRAEHTRHDRGRNAYWRHRHPDWARHERHDGHRGEVRHNDGHRGRNRDHHRNRDHRGNRRH